MNSTMEGQTFLFVWIGFLLLTSGGIALFFLWAIRARQFSHQDRARYLALQAGIPPLTGERDAERRQEQGRPAS